MIKLNNESKMKALFFQAPFFVAAGLFYGFPECCVEGFATSYNMEVREKYPNLASKGSGYIPCACCAPEVQKDWEGFKQNVIMKNRHSDLPFPADYNNKALDRFFHKLAMHLGEDSLLLAQDLRTNDELIKTIKEEKKLEEGKLSVNKKFNKYIEKCRDITIDNVFDYCINNETTLSFLYKPTIQLMSKLFKDKDASCIQFRQLDECYVLESIKDQLNVLTRLNNNNDTYENSLKDILPQLAQKVTVQLMSDMNTITSDMINKNKNKKKIKI